jgi:hypothetical protein
LSECFNSRATGSNWFKEGDRHRSRPTGREPKKSDDYDFMGASTSENTWTASGSLAPLISIAETAAFSSTSSEDEKLTVGPPMFSIMWAICVVPGIGTMNGF